MFLHQLYKDGWSLGKNTSITEWIILKDQQSAAFKIAVPFAILAFFVIRITVALSYRGVHNLGRVSKKDWYWLT